MTRAAILEAAEGIFAEVGLAGARIDAIAGAAGINKAMLYYYFKSKEGLYRAVLEGVANVTSVNPARSTGPAIFMGGWAINQLWLFWVAPIVGAAVAGVVYKVVFAE